MVEKDCWKFFRAGRSERQEDVVSKDALEDQARDKAAPIAQFRFELACVCITLLQKKCCKLV